MGPQLIMIGYAARAQNAVDLISFDHGDELSVSHVAGHTQIHPHTCKNLGSRKHLEAARVVATHIISNQTKSPSFSFSEYFCQGVRRGIAEENDQIESL